jgi:hypothetical protein
VRILATQLQEALGIASRPAVVSPYSYSLLRSGVTVAQLKASFTYLLA